MNLALTLAITILVTVAAGPRQASAQSVLLTGHAGFRWTRMYEDDARLLGGGIGIMLNDRSRLELVGYRTEKPSRYSTLDFSLAYGGVQLDRDLARKGRFVVGTAVALALGRFTVEDRLAGTTDRASVWLIDPELFVAMDVGQRLRIAAGGGRRWVRGVEGRIPNRSDGDAEGPVLALRLIFR